MGVAKTVGATGRRFLAADREESSISMTPAHTGDSSDSLRVLERAATGDGSSRGNGVILRQMPGGLDS